MVALIVIVPSVRKMPGVGRQRDFPSFRSGAARSGPDADPSVRSARIGHFDANQTGDFHRCRQQNADFKWPGGFPVPLPRGRESVELAPDVHAVLTAFGSLPLFVEKE
jgi:hypothetical protein